MATETVGATLTGDFRLADFKLLLPLSPPPRTLVVDATEWRFLAHLAGELGALDLVFDPDRPPNAQTLDDLRAGNEQVRPRTAPEGRYDLVFSDDTAAAAYLRPGGVLCQWRVGSEEPVDDRLLRIGRWRAYPSWPDFRILIPEHTAGWRAASRSLRLFSARTPLGLATRIHPGMAASILPEAGLTLYRRLGGDPLPSLLDRIKASLDTAPALEGAARLPATAATDWLLASGRLGPGNPVLAFSLDRKGQPRHLLKVARYPKAAHLEAELIQLRSVVRAVGPAVAEPIIQPVAATRHEQRWALAYTYEPTQPFFGPRWRLQGRSGFCAATTDWLARLGQATRRQPEPAAFTERHIAPLERLLHRRILPETSQHQGEMALHQLRQQARELPEILEHGDLGIYNTRLSTADGRRFRVLDWGSSTFQGIPFGDLGYLLASANAPVPLALRCFRDYCRGMNLAPDIAAGSWFSYLARRWEELDAIRPPVPEDPGSGGGILLPTQARVGRYLQALAADAGESAR